MFEKMRITEGAATRMLECISGGVSAEEFSKEIAVLQANYDGAMAKDARIIIMRDDPIRIKDLANKTKYKSNKKLNEYKDYWMSEYPDSNISDAWFKALYDIIYNVQKKKD